MTVFSMHRSLGAAAGFAGVSRVLALPLRRWRTFTAAIFDPYRPELHYMRGPGPKWREKHAAE